jgi:membrane fusion protein, multidrug efflux system
MRRVTLALAFVLGTGLACSGGGPETAEVGPTVLQPDDLVTVSRKPIATGPRLSGTLEPALKAVLRAETNGSIVDLRVEIGDHVVPGQILARIDNRAAGSALQSARSSVTSSQQSVLLAEREVQRVRTLVEAGALSARDLEQAESGVIQARAGLAGANAQLSAQGEQVDATVVKSPLAGVVSSREVSEGDVVSPGLGLFTVIEPSSLRLDASVPAASATHLMAGSPVFFSVQGYDDRLFQGKVERVAPAVDSASRQIPVLVSVPNQDGELLAGLFAEGRVATEQREGFVVPSGAIIAEGSRPHVLRVEEGVVRRVPVTIGLADDQADTVEITEGVADGDQLLMAGVHDVAPGTKVEVREPSAKNEEG